MTRFTSKLVQTTLLTSGLFLFSACGGGGASGDTQAPIADTFTPDNGAVGVALDTTVSAVFDEAMIDLSIAEDSFYLRAANGTEVNATVAYDNTNDTATLTPRKPLALLTDYTATLTNDNLDLAGNELAMTSWSFTTRDGRWRGMTRVEYYGTYSDEVQTDIDSNGDAVAIWRLDGHTTHTLIAANFYTKDTNMWNTETILSDRDTNATSSPQIVFYDKAKAVAVWSQKTSTGAYAIHSRKLINGSWSADISLTSTDYPIYALKLASNRSGDVVLVWLQHDGSHISAYGRYFSDGAWSAQKKIEDFDDGDVLEVEATIDPTGLATLVWVEAHNTQLILRSRTLQDAYLGSWVVALSLHNTPSLTKIASDPQGNVMVIWSESEGGIPVHIRTSYYDKEANTWRVTTTISGSTDDLKFDPQIAFDHAGNAMAIWSQVVDGETNIYANRFKTEEGWETPTLLENLSGYINVSRIKLDDAGHAIAVWRQRFDGHMHIFVNRYTKDIGWSGASLIDNTRTSDAGAVNLSVNPSGEAIIAWNNYGGTRSDIMVEHFR